MAGYERHSRRGPVASAAFSRHTVVANVAWIPVHAGAQVNFLLLHRQKRPLRLPA
jgi:hypothetical protein